MLFEFYYYWTFFTLSILIKSNFNTDIFIILSKKEKSKNGWRGKIVT